MVYVCVHRPSIRFDGLEAMILKQNESCWNILRVLQVEQEKRELETRLGATPPPSPSDRNSPAFLNTRIVDLSTEVDRLKKMLADTKIKSGCSPLPLSASICVYVCRWP